MIAGMAQTSGPDRRMPTVIVARRVAPGREREFERWSRRLMAAASEAPGYVGAEVQRPDARHPDEWVVVYQFSDAERLSRWLASPERAAVLATGAELLAGEVREQVVALTPQSDPVTAVSSVRVRPGAQHHYRALHEDLVEQLRGFDGFLRSELFEPVPGVQDDTVVVFAFEGRDRMERWLASDERRAVLERMEPLIEGARTVTVLGGFAGWFAGAAGIDVPRWKQAVVVIGALFPTSLALTLLREWLLPDLPLAPGVLLGNVAGVGILTWLVMPVLTRRLEPWLRR
jgi:uncharacterized protein